MQSWKNSCELKNCKYFIFYFAFRSSNFTNNIPPTGEDRNEGFLEYRVQKGQKSFKGQR